MKSRFKRSLSYGRVGSDFGPGPDLLHDQGEVEEEGVVVAAGVGLKANGEAVLGEAGRDGDGGVAGEVGGDCEGAGVVGADSDFADDVRHGTLRIERLHWAGGAEDDVGPLEEVGHRFVHLDAELVEICRHRGVAVQTIKSLTVGPWGDKERITRTWYEALTEQADVDLAVHWVLGHEEVFLNSSSDLGLLEKIVDAAERYAGPPARADIEAMMSRTAMSPLFK